MLEKLMYNKLIPFSVDDNVLAEDIPEDSLVRPKYVI
jgi:hypothetical protein